MCQHVGGLRFGPRP